MPPPPNSTRVLARDSNRTSHTCGFGLFIPRNDLEAFSAFLFERGGLLAKENLISNETTRRDKQPPDQGVGPTPKTFENAPHYSPCYDSVADTSTTHSFSLFSPCCALDEQTGVVFISIRGTVAVYCALDMVSCPSSWLARYGLTAFDKIGWLTVYCSKRRSKG